MSISPSLSERRVTASDLDADTSRRRRSRLSARGAHRYAGADRRPDMTRLHRWQVRGSLAATLLATAALYIVGLSKSGWANAFYSAAAQAGSKSWEALFYGASDAGNSITVDKPPAAMWIMGLSVRLFGLSSWSILVPEALMGVASVAVLYLAVRRSLGFDRTLGRFAPTMRAHWAALAGAGVFALTPVATLMFRFNNPDALLVLLETVAAYCVIRATEYASRRWMVGAGVAIGFGFLTKMLQAFLVLPAFAVAYLICAPASWRRRVVDLLAAFAAMVVSMGWFIALVELVPASSRPFIGGSQHNSFLELVFGYNGLGRITGNETGSLGGGMGESTGLTRLFTGVSAGMVSWLIPAALVLTGFAVAMLGRRSLDNTLPLRAGERSASGRTQALSGLVVFVGWLVATLLTFSFMAGIFHDYYTVALAPAIGGTVAIAAGILWMHRNRLTARVGLALSEALTVVWAVHLATKAGGVYTWVAAAAAVIGTFCALALLFADRLSRALAGTTIALATAAALAAPASYSLQTASTAHTGSIVTAGPVSGGMGGGPGGGHGGQNGPGGNRGAAPGGTGNAPQAPGGTTSQAGGKATGSGSTTTNRTAPTGGMGDGGPGNGGGGGMGNIGALLNGANVSTAMATLLETNASSYTWSAATIGSQTAASYQLASNTSVMALGGFNGSDPSPTLAQFKQYVAEGRIHWFIGSGSTASSSTGGSNDAAQIASWVSQNFTAKTVDGVTVYDLTSAK